MTESELLELAKKASERAYAPYSDFKVGAALECADGAVFLGCNVENSAYGDTICAERTAMVKAISEGNRDFRRIAIYADSKDYCYPCGSCRQFMAEFNRGDMDIVCAKHGGEFISRKLKELLPGVFNY